MPISDRNGLLQQPLDVTCRKKIPRSPPQRPIQAIREARLRRNQPSLGRAHRMTARAIIDAEAGAVVVGVVQAGAKAGGVYK